MSDEATPSTVGKPTGSIGSKLSLDEFCIRLSEKKFSPELIAGFQFTQLKANKNRASDAAFNAAFEAFVHKPA